MEFYVLIFHKLFICKHKFQEWYKNKNHLDYALRHLVETLSSLDFLRLESRKVLKEERKIGWRNMQR